MKIILSVIFIYLNFLFADNELLDSLKNLPMAYEADKNKSNVSIDINLTNEKNKDDKKLFCEESKSFKCNFLRGTAEGLLNIIDYKN